MIADVHTHTNFSPDSETSIEEMLTTALEKQVAFYGISDHFEYGATDDFCPSEEKEKTYFHHARHLQEDYAGCMNVLIGMEIGYYAERAAQERGMRACQTYQPDFVVNSVHACNGEDYFSQGPMLGKDKTHAYNEYLDLVYQSLFVPYPYDVVGHIGYATRYAPYEDRHLCEPPFFEKIDRILTTIIQKNKILEINSSNKGGVETFLPERGILERYFALGGRKISFASDAHDPSRIAEGYAQAIALLKEIGFPYLTVPCKGEYIQIRI